MDRLCVDAEWGLRVVMKTIQRLEACRMDAGFNDGGTSYPATVIAYFARDQLKRMILCKRKDLDKEEYAPRVR